MPLLARHPYDVSKSCGEAIAQCYHHTYDVPVAIARCSNIYGGGDLNWSRIVPGTIRIGDAVAVGEHERPVAQQLKDLLELVIRRYERAATMITSNRPVDDWGKLLGDTAAVTRSWTASYITRTS